MLLLLLLLNQQLLIIPGTRLRCCSMKQGWLGRVSWWLQQLVLRPRQLPGLVQCNPRLLL
jgi:hypothetical protein